MATVGERFQVVIERDVRGELGIQPGDRAVETVENGRLVITFLPRRHRRSLRGRLADAGRIEDFAVERDRLGERLARDDAERGGRDRP
ncbi:MAG: AbrB/MazE/SpoVT family DNA-binding domain-containing protein [Thermoanaerobaculia bacterium]